MKAEIIEKVEKIISYEGIEFGSIDNADIEDWCELMSPWVSQKQFGKLYPFALAYLIMHKWKMAGKGENPLGDLGQIGVGFGIGSVSEGGSSISFGAGQSSNLADDAELALTKYGLEYLSLRRMVIIPIHSSGELDIDMDLGGYYGRI